MRRTVPCPVPTKSRRYTVLFAVLFLALGVAWTAAAVPEKKGEPAPNPADAAAAPQTPSEASAASPKTAPAENPVETTVETVTESVEIVPETVVTETAVPSEAEKLFNDAVDLYLYAFPAVVLDQVREEMTSRFFFAPVNKMAYRTDLPEPGEDGCGIPSRDAFLSSAWFDLEKGPRIVLMPAHSRFDFILELFDEWTNVIGSVDSLSSADWPVFDYDSRPVKAFAVAGPNNQTALPDGVTVFTSDTPYLWLVNRLLLNEACCTPDANFAPACRTLYEFEVIKPDEFEKKAHPQTAAQPEQSRTIRIAPTELFSTLSLPKMHFNPAPAGLSYQHQFTADTQKSVIPEQSKPKAAAPDKKPVENKPVENKPVEPKTAEKTDSEAEDNEAEDNDADDNDADDNDADEEEVIETSGELLELTLIPETAEETAEEPDEESTPADAPDAKSEVKPEAKKQPAASEPQKNSPQKTAPQKSEPKTDKPASKPQSRYELHRDRSGRAVWIQKAVFSTETAASPTAETKPAESKSDEAKPDTVKKESKWDKKREEWKEKGEKIRHDGKDRFDRFEEDTTRLFRHGYDHSRHWVEEAYDSSREGLEEAHRDLHRHLHRDLHRLAALFDEDSLESYPFYYVMNLSGPEFFDRFAKILKTSSASLNPEMAEKLKHIGIVPGESFDREKIDPAVRRLLRFVPVVAQMRMDEYLLTRMREHEGMGRWVCPMKLGNFGDDYICRARATEKFLGAGTAQEILYPFTFIDSNNQPFSGKERYKIHFSADALPPAEMGWSITLYDPNFCLVPNPEHRYALSSRQPLHFNEDGSLDLFIGGEGGEGGEIPKEGENISNFLPAPEGEFMLMMRLYRPKAEALDGRWLVPAAVKISADTPQEGK